MTPFPRIFRFRAQLSLASSLMVFLPAAALESEPEEPFWLSTIRRNTELPAETALHVSNRYGDVRARGLDSGPLEVIAAVQRFEEDQPEAEIHIREENGALRVEVHFPSADSPQPGDPLQGRVDVTVMVPRGSELHLESDHGLVEARGVDRDLYARSREGRLELITSRPLDARAERGDTQLLLQRSLPNRPHRIRSSSGDIQLNIPASEPLSLRARTGGEIANQLAAEFAPFIEEGGELRVGAAPFAIEIESASGNIDLHSR